MAMSVAFWSGSLLDWQGELAALKARLAPVFRRLRVTTTGGTSSNTSADNFRYAGAPTITSITPDTAVVGTKVTIFGTVLKGVTAVTFNGVAANFTDTPLPPDVLIVRWVNILRTAQRRRFSSARCWNNR